MIFASDMIETLREGRKTHTRRLVTDNPRSPWYQYRCAYVPGRAYSINPGRGKRGIGFLELRRDPHIEGVDEISEADAKKEGFDSRDAFLTYFSELNGRDALRRECWVLSFSVLTIR